MQFNIDTDIPGPGAYKPPSTFALNARSITIRPRPAAPKPPDGPGPTEYTPSRSSGEKATIGVRYRARRASPAPGPLSYRIEPDHKAKSAIIGQKCFKEKKPEPRPSVWDYDPKPVRVQRELKIGERIGDKITDTPGPGEYKVEVAKPNGGRIHERLHDQKIENPEIGPGKYHHQQKFSEGGFTFQGRTKRYWRLE